MKHNKEKFNMTLLGSFVYWKYRVRIHGTSLKEIKKTGEIRVTLYNRELAENLTKPLKELNYIRTPTGIIWEFIRKDDLYFIYKKTDFKGQNTKNKIF